jgi:hypothetical protein
MNTSRLNARLSREHGFSRSVSASEQSPRRQRSSSSFVLGLLPLLILASSCSKNFVPAGVNGYNHMGHFAMAIFTVNGAAGMNYPMSLTDQLPWFPTITKVEALRIQKSGGMTNEC